MTKERNGIETRSDKVRKLLGDMPAGFTCMTVVVIIIDIIAILIAATLIWDA
jgi:hypothetical protein